MLCKKSGFGGIGGAKEVVGGLEPGTEGKKSSIVVCVELGVTGEGIVNNLCRVGFNGLVIEKGCWPDSDGLSVSFV